MLRKFLPNKRSDCTTINKTDVECGNMLVSKNGYSFIAQNDGNGVWFKPDGSRDTSDLNCQYDYTTSYYNNFCTPPKGSTPPMRWLMQADGNFVMYDSNRKPVWETGTSSPGTKDDFSLIMQDDGNIVLYRLKDNKVMWSSYDVVNQDHNFFVSFVHSAGSIWNFVAKFIAIDLLFAAFVFCLLIPGLGEEADAFILVEAAELTESFISEGVSEEVVLVDGSFISDDFFSAVDSFIDQ